MSYVNSVLGKDEIVRYEATVSLLSFLFRFVLGAIITLSSIGLVFMQPAVGGMFLTVGLILIAQPIITKETTELVITNRRIIAKFGLIRRHTIELNISKIESISVSQSILGRMLNYGDLIIVGTGGTREPIPNIRQPLVFRRKFDEILNG